MTERRPIRFPARLRGSLAAPAAALVLGLSQLPALEVVGDQPPAYLAERMRSDWRMTPLSGVLDQVATFIEKPLVRTKNVLAAGDRPVVQVDERKVALREALELLERAQGLRFTAEALRLRVETDQDFRDRRRRPVNLSLRDFASGMVVRDFPGPELAFAAGARGGGNGFDLMSDAKGDQAPTPEDVIDRLKAAAGGGDLEMRGNGNVFLMVTPEEEQAMRVELQRQFDRSTRRSAWRATFGTLAGDGAIVSGVVSAADGAALAKRLGDAQRLDAAALNGQRVHAGAVKGESYVADATVVNDRLDPTVEVLRLGRVLDVCPALGLERDLLTYRLRWADEAEPPRTTEVRHADAPAPLALDGTVKLEKKGEQQEGTVSVADGSRAGAKGGGVVIQQPSVWTWQPRGDVYLAHDQALVLVSGHPAGRAVIVVERLP